MAGARTGPVSTRPPVGLGKAYQFLLALFALLAVDALTPRFPGWPQPLIHGPAPSPPPIELPAARARPLEAPTVVPPSAAIPQVVSLPPARRVVDPVEPLIVPDDPRWASLVRKLERRAAGGQEAIRVLHLGDSEIANDDVSSTLRRRFSDRFGDAGPGFVLALAPWSWYLRQGFTTSEPDGFSIRSLSRLTGGEGNFGPGGAAFDAKYAGATASVGVDPGEHGSCEVSLVFGTQPGGAAIAVSADGRTLGQVDTEGPEGVSTQRFTLRPCPRRLTARASALPTRLFGWNVEWGEPGVVWSTLGFVGSSAQHFLTYAPDRLGESLAALRPDLVIVAHGLNVANKDTPPSEREEAGLRLALTEVRRATPEAACLVMTPYPIASTDSGEVAPSGSLGALVALQRRVALASGCAFLDRVALEGGGQTALSWLKARPRVLSADNVHLTRRGAERVGDDVAQILLGRLAGGG